MNAWERLTRLSRHQYGLVSLAQAVELGIAPRTLQERVAHQGWTRLHPGVYALPGSSRSYERDVAGMLLAAGQRSAASHQTAAALMGVTGVKPRPLHLLLPADRRALRLHHRSRTLRTVDVVTIGGLRTTSVARTICDLAALEVPTLRELTAVALQRRLTSVGRIESCSARLGSHAGVGHLRIVLGQLRGTSSDSGFERRVRDWLCANGLPPHPCLYPVRAEDDVVVELDIAFPPQMVFVDCLGFPWHSLPSSLVSDAIRGNGVTAAGWQSLRLTEQQFAERDPRFLRQLRRLLQDRAGFGAQLGQGDATRRPQTW